MIPYSPGFDGYLVPGLSPQSQASPFFASSPHRDDLQTGNYISDTASTSLLPPASVFASISPSSSPNVGRGFLSPSSPRSPASSLGTSPSRNPLEYQEGSILQGSTGSQYTRSPHQKKSPRSSLTDGPTRSPPSSLFYLDDMLVKVLFVSMKRLTATR